MSEDMFLNKQRVDAAVYAEIKRTAKEQHRSIGEQVEHILASWFRQQKAWNILDSDEGEK